MKRNSLTTAVLAGLTGLAGMASVSHAVNVNPDGLGQVLLYPYYTVRGGNDTLISIVNTTSDHKAVKVRFMEALNSREVLDFNLYLSPWDVWTAALQETAAGGGKMTTTDRSCTVPNLFELQGGVQDFLNFQYTGPNNDRGPQGIERTASGYIEVIEMGVVTDSTVQGFIKHVNGVPGNCNALTGLWTTGPWATDPSFGLAPPSGGLFGSGTIVNVRQGTMLSYNAVAIDSFWSAGVISHTDPGSILPNLNSGDTTSRVFVNRTGVVDVDEQVWLEGVEAVNATIMHNQLFNEYGVLDVLAGRTEWVMTFPTKAFHVDNAPGGKILGAGPIPPFTNLWLQGGAGGQACERVTPRVWDREEREPATGIIVSPPPPKGFFEICREAEIIRFSRDGNIPAATEIFGEPERPAFSTLTPTNFELPAGFQEGWLRFDFADGDNRTSRPAVRTGDRYVGLPVIGFSAQTFNNGVLPGGTLSNYGATFNHRGSRKVLGGTQS